MTSTSINIIFYEIFQLGGQLFLMIALPPFHLPTRLTDIPSCPLITTIPFGKQHLGLRVPWGISCVSSVLAWGSAGYGVASMVGGVPLGKRLLSLR